MVTNTRVRRQPTARGWVKALIHVPAYEDETLERAKRYADKHGTSLSAAMIALLRRGLKRGGYRG